jgi:hypothetical protein
VQQMTRVQVDLTSLPARATASDIRLQHRGGSSSGSSGSNTSIAGRNTSADITQADEGVGTAGQRKND